MPGSHWAYIWRKESAVALSRKDDVQRQPRAEEWGACWMKSRKHPGPLGPAARDAKAWKSGKEGCIGNSSLTHAR